MHVAPTDTAALFASVREMTGTVDERVTSLIGHLTTKFQEVEAKVVNHVPDAIQ